MKLELSTNIMPVISVGMYGTLLDANSMYDHEEQEIYLSDILTEEEKDYFASADFNIEKYKELVAKRAVEAIEEFFDDIKGTIKVKLISNEKIRSPREYNFYTDEMDFTVEIEQEEIDKIFRATVNNKEFFEWAKRYKSYDGFISYMPHTWNDYMKAIGGHDLERAVAMYLTYVAYMREKDGYIGNYYESMIENIGCNSGLLDFYDDERACEIAWKAWNAA